MKKFIKVCFKFMWNWKTILIGNASCIILAVIGGVIHRLGLVKNEAVREVMGGLNYMTVNVWKAIGIGIKGTIKYGYKKIFNK